MALCESTRYDGKRCEETAHAGQSLCILHDPSSDKDRALFLATLKARVEREEKVQLEAADPTTWHVDLGGVVFPPGFRWADVSGGRPLGKGVMFSRATFTGDADFGRARFSGPTDFGVARFSANAVFAAAQFPGGVGFEGAMFIGNADFGGATFSGVAAFVGTTFSRDTDFIEAMFEKSLLFVHTQFPQVTGANPPGARGPGTVSFNGVTLHEPEGVLFQDVDLSRTSFLGTDLRHGTNLRHVRFINVTWAERSEWLRPWLTRRRCRILFDDPRATGEKGTEETRYHQAAELYRQLRLNMEESKQEIEAGDFYIAQMDMRLHDTRLGRLHRGLLWLYGRAVLYGESYWRPLFLYGITALLFGLLYLAAGFHSVHRPVLDLAALADWAFWKDYGEAVVLALRAGPIPVSEPVALSRWMLPLRYLNALANVLLLAVAVIALRRAFRR